MNIKGYLFALIAIFFWSFNNLIAQRFASDATPLELATGRWTFAALILLPLTFKSLKKSIPFFQKNWLWLMMLGISGIVFDNTLIYVAGHTVSAADIGILSVIGPIFLALLSYVFLKTPIRPVQLIGMGIALAGVLIIITNGHIESIWHMSFPIGDLYIIINAFCFALYSFLQLKKPPQLDQRTLLSATVLAGLLILYPLTFIKIGVSNLIHLSLLDYSLFIYLGVFNSVLAYLSWNSALSNIGPVKTGIIYYLLPVFTAIEAYFLLGDSIGTAQIIGGILVISGIALVSVIKKHSNSTPALKTTHKKNSLGA